MLPLKLGELIDRLADTLESHVQTLDLTDANARTERDVYMELAARHRGIASELRAAARAMDGHRDLPMARHDEEALTSPPVLGTFRGFVEAEDEALALLQHEVEKHRGMLAEPSG